MDEEQVLGEVEKLKAALSMARLKIEEQDSVLRRLTAPPFIHATVLQKIDSANEVKPPPDRQYQFLGGSWYTVSTKKKKFSNGLRLGDLLALKPGKSVRDEVERAKKLQIVGTYDERLVIQIDDGRCMRDWEQKVSELYDKLPSKAPTLVVAVDDALMQVAYPATCEANIGDIVILNRDTMQIVDVTTAKLAGSIGFIRRLIDDTFCEVDFDGSIRVSFNGKPEHKLEKGDRVMLDSRGIVVLQNLGKDDSRYTVSEATNVDWDHIGGLEDAKQQMIEAVELPHKNPKIFKFYNKRPVKGILLYGPPGCGKTMLGKACATSLAKIYSGGNGSNGFIYIKGPEILDRYVGVAEATIRQIFQRAKRHKDSHGYPAVLFIDEADALLAKRGSGISSDVERTIVPMFLTEMDGLEESGALVILATNRSDILDPAIVRDGRIDRKIKVTRPTLRSAEDIVLMNLQDVPLNNGYTKAELAELAAKEVFSPKRILYEITTKASMTRIFTLGHIVNGGMLVGVVDLATSFALQRDLEIGAPMGLRKEDLIAAVDSIERQNRDLNHTDELAEFIHDYKADVVGITRLSQSSK